MVDSGNWSCSYFYLGGICNHLVYDSFLADCLLYTSRSRMKEYKKMKNLPEIQENSKGFENKWIVEETHMPFRNYKDRVFRMIFTEKKEFMECLIRYMNMEGN